MKKYLVFNWLMLFYLPLALAGKELKYPIAAIPKNLLEKADAVVRLDQTTYTVESRAGGKIRGKIAVSILNEAGLSHAVHQVGYDKKFYQIPLISGKLYNAAGEEIGTLKKSDIRDMSAISDFSLYEDDRVKLAYFTYRDYPFTVEYEYEQIIGSTVFFPNWYAQSGYRLSVEKAVLNIVAPAELALRYREINMPPHTEVSGSAGNKTWTVGQLAAKEPEPYSNQYDDFFFIEIAAGEFELEGYTGNESSWEAIGAWQQHLLKDRDKLPQNIKDQVAKIVSETSSKVERIRKLYEYMQSTTRYVSIQLGIGGWQPFPAREVAEKGYGDCKALSNYMKAMLQEAGINAHYTLVYAGSNYLPLERRFPSRRFNHVILCVPVEADTLWLECTSQSNPMGYLGNFTGDRDVLLITPDGGRIAHTRAYKKSDNQLLRSAEVKISDEGNASAQVNTTYTGTKQDEAAMVSMQGLEEQKRWLYKNIHLPSFEINSFKLDYQKTMLPLVNASLQLSIRQLASKSGKRLFLSPNLLAQHETLLPESPNRRNRVFIAKSFTESDTIRYQLPQGYHIEFKPEDNKLETPFGSYFSSVKVEGNQLIYIRQFLLNAGYFPPESYQQLAEFFRNVAKADKIKVVLVNNT